ncbi:uncharacterized protein A4U43_C02F10440 [Asparagus officinalis]|uniref:Uncharacterized protein n=1 Tax=Asparagus officinalis TaxID=4686 RepID=A0A5P1FLF0_ASPOF|nr:uncharacterized protein A4U43_C02F10440 [Asparagus officinalis]
MVREGYELIGRLDLGDHFGVGGILDFYGVGRRCEGLAARVRVLFGRVVEERRRGGELAGDDFLSVLLGLPTDEGLSDSDVIAVLWVRDDIQSDRRSRHPPGVDHGPFSPTPGYPRPSPTRTLNHRGDPLTTPTSQTFRISKRSLKERQPRNATRGPGLLSWARLAGHDRHVGNTLSRGDHRHG